MSQRTFSHDCCYSYDKNMTPSRPQGRQQTNTADLAMKCLSLNKNISLCLFHCFVLQARTDLLISISTSVANLLSLLALLSLGVKKKKKNSVANKPDKACNTNNDNIAPWQRRRGRAYICYLIRCACDLMLDF